MPTGQEEVYGIVSAFAEKQYYLMISISEGLDKKADEHLRFMATVGGAILAAVAAKLISFERPWLAVVGLALFCVALFTAITIRTPQKSSIPMSPRELLSVAELNSKPAKHQVESVTAASYHVAILGMRSLTTWKARLLTRSTLAFIMGLLVLLGSILHR